MQLLFFLGNDLIDSVWLNPAQISKPGYVGHIKRTLQRKHQHLILEDSNAPEFLVMPAAASTAAAPATQSYSYAAA